MLYRTMYSHVLYQQISVTPFNPVNLTCLPAESTQQSDADTRGEGLCDKTFLMNEVAHDYLVIGKEGVALSTEEVVVQDT